ncbi:MAG: D-alanine--D-alanine ligase family protein [Deltaproteobacteria bacterium]|nr:D-alanine--D-alanine ligase family protein [Deltaproteobacteria bacterium]
MRTVGILFGGRSGEHPISIRSSQFVVESLDRSRFAPVLIGIDRAGGWHLLSEDEYWRLETEVPVGAGRSVVALPAGVGRCGLLDPRVPHGALPVMDVVFPVLHGPYGEDGTMQGLLETFDVPYVGIGVLGAALCMDKDVCKRLLRDAGIPVVPSVLVRAHDWTRNRAALCAAARQLGPTLFVKPASLGSSLGVTRVSETADATVAAAVENALRLDGKVLIEAGIDGREIECAVLGNAEPRASRPGEILPGEAFYSYADKYAPDSLAQTRIPADIDATTREQVRALAVRAFVALECSGMARVDFFLERGGGRLYVNELNTIPGFTSISMYPKMWEAEGIGGPELVTRLIELGLERWATRHALASH